MIQAIGYVIIIGACLFEMGYRFTHPELTETQLFLRTWPVFLVVCVGVVVLLVGARRLKKRGE